jgi:hypothetical protein
MKWLRDRLKVNHMWMLIAFVLSIFDHLYKNIQIISFKPLERLTIQTIGITSMCYK